MNSQLHRSSSLRTNAIDSGQREAIALLLLRMAAGGFLLPHGLGKLFGWFGGPGVAGFAAELQGFGLPSFTPLPLLLALVQTLAGLAVAIGLWTRGAASLAAAFIAMTVWIGLPSGWFWMHHGIEYPLMWTAMLVAIALLGGGPLSVDAWRAARRQRPHL